MDMIFQFADHMNFEILYGEIDVEQSRNKHIVRVADKHEINRFADRHPQWYGRDFGPQR